MYASNHVSVGELVRGALSDSVRPGAHSVNAPSATGVQC